MRIKTEREMIQDVVKRFGSTYASQISASSKIHFSSYPNYAALFADLEKLDLDECSAKDVNDIIGNDSWTRLLCNECGDWDKKIVIELGEPLDYESSTAQVCLDCFDKAAALINKKPAEAG